MSRQGSHGLIQNMGHEGQSRQFGMNEQQERLAWKTPEQVNTLGAMLTSANPQRPMQPLQNAQVQRHIAVALQSQGRLPDGVRKSPSQTEPGKITSLRLIQPRIEIQNVLQNALQYEEKAFREANQRYEYEKECASKLHAIKERGLRQQAAYS
ncbi:hypothetical protein PMAA_064730 [Talaromyces marneffei ATCC 18224]|uniref:Mediator complex subunit 15 KIX domain-containing protein n=1 Tax=Talaromyces marneffei (strain ATCC 18224 / CBS 334.59 / QM 7333) TaxID=441960 RepID=B6QB21_TALMQ|nr:hypothetical protein PMAA_064730 [Talaromyces marneffei ATCC 18224]